MPSPTDITYKKFGDVDELKVLQCLRMAQLKALQHLKAQLQEEIFIYLQEEGYEGFDFRKNEFLRVNSKTHGKDTIFFPTLP